ncbi:MAG: HEAT repeat domain-containing protein [Candidatus Brocadiae bacterium]|nr:HEAT repeat domain-containing protein [Candidatus Brocadiia bacterium]
MKCECYLGIVFFVLLFIGCQSSRPLLSAKEDSVSPVEIQVKQHSEPNKISPEDRQNLRDWLSVFYRGNKKPEWKEAREKILKLGSAGSEAICIFMLKFFYGGKKKIALADRDEDVARYWEQAKEELSYLKGDAVPYILYTMSHPSIGSTGRMLCSQTLVKIGKPSLDPLIQNMEKGTRSFQRSVIETLGNLDHPKAAMAISNLYCRLPIPLKKNIDIADELQDDDTFDLRFSAIKALGVLSYPDGLKAIEKALDDTNSLVVKESLKALLNFNGEECLPILKKSLEKVNHPVFSGYRKKIENKLFLLNQE